MTQRREMAAPWFGSRTLALHLLRGAVGVGSFVLGIWLAATGHLLAALASLLVMLAVLRGCPMCWLLGLVQTLTAGRLKATCVDGSCAPSQVRDAVPTEVRLPAEQAPPDH